MRKKCSKCGHPSLESMVPTLYHYKLSGLDNVYLKGGVTEYLCEHCGMKSTAIQNVIGLHRAIASRLAVAKRRLTGSELRFLRERLGFSAEELARIVEYNEGHVRKIESGSQAPKAPYEMFLRLAVMRELRAPDYDLRELAKRRKYKLEELKFVNKDHEWTTARAA